MCLELGIKYTGLASTTWTLPFGAGDTGYEADEAYYVQSHGTTKTHHPPDLAIEVVVSHSEKKALRAGAFLKIPEMWVLDIPRRRRKNWLRRARRWWTRPAPWPPPPRW